MINLGNNENYLRKRSTTFYRGEKMATRLNINTVTILSESVKLLVYKCFVSA